MVFSSPLSWSALALAGYTAHALPNNVVKPTLLNGASIGRFTLPSVKINDTGFAVRARGRSSTDVGSK
jgi:hypothetical protein